MQKSKKENETLQAENETLQAENGRRFDENAAGMNMEKFHIRNELLAIQAEREAEPETSQSSFYSNSDSDESE